MKRKITFFLTLIMLLSFIAVPANAAVKPPDASIQWTHILNPDLTVDFDGTTCISSASVQGQSTTSLEGSITIFQRSGERYYYWDSVSDTTTGSELTIDYEFESASGLVYLIIFNFTANYSGGSENDVLSTAATCP